MEANDLLKKYGNDIKSLITDAVDAASELSGVLRLEMQVSAEFLPDAPDVLCGLLHYLASLGT